MLLRATVLASSGDVEAAKRILEAPLVTTTLDMPADLATRATTRAIVMLAGREWDAAAQDASVAVQADPTRWEAHRALAQAELGRGNPEAALAAAQSLLARWPNDGPALYLRAAALLELGREDEGRSSLTAAAERLALSPVYQARIAQLAQLHGLASPHP